jgi:hypothetical protein
VQDGVDAEGARRVFVETDPVISHTQTQLGRINVLKFLHVAFAGSTESIEGGENTHGIWRSMRRTSARADGVKMIFFTAPLR